PDNSHDQNQQQNWHLFSRKFGYQMPDRGFERIAAATSDGRPVEDPKAVFSGLFGADRDGDHMLDRGDLPPSVRLQAHEVARFQYYDPRLSLVLR
ncbi:MAG: hypothetical protein PF961_17380, partial [Planctomycetota bacterium]|nr:hypothetical protein [Planctomycetota bacterium]